MSHAKTDFRPVHLLFLSLLMVATALTIAACGGGPTDPAPIDESLIPETGVSAADIAPSGIFSDEGDRVISLEARPQVVPPGGGSVELVAEVTRDGKPESGVPVVFETSAGRFASDAAGDTGAAGRISRTLRTSVAAIVKAKIQVAGVTVLTSREVRIAVGELTDGSTVEFAADLRSRRPEAGRAEVLQVSAQRGDAPVAGLLTVEFGDGKRTVLEDFGGTATVQHTWREASVYQVRLELTEPTGAAHARTLPVEIFKPAADALKMSVRTRRVAAREPVAIQIRPELRGDPAPGDVLIDWGDGRSSRMNDLEKPTWVEHAYREKGSYSILATLDGGRGKRSRARTRVRITEPLRLTGTLTTNTSAPTVDRPVSFVFQARRSDGRKAEGTTRIKFGDGSSDTLKVSGSRSFSHVYRRPGTYKVEAELTDEDGRVAKAAQQVAVREPDSGGGGGSGGGSGGGGGTGGTGGGGGGSDAIDPGSIAWLHANTSSWSVTSTITNVSISGGQVCISHTKAGGWPVVSGIEGNPWVVANIGGRWYAGTYEWLRPGQVCKNITAATIGPHVKVSPLSGWRPKSGETVYFMVSTPGRAGVSTINQRSNIVRVVWP